MEENKEYDLIRDFNEGDLLYGLEKQARWLYRHSIIEKIRDDRQKNGRSRDDKPIYETVDKIHNAFNGKVLFNNDYDVALSPLSTPVKRE